jgi:hypothetical protein
MSFTFCESMIENYWARGYVILQGILPPSLRRDLRREAAKGRDLIRRDRGPQVPRVDQVGAYAEDLNLQRFRDYAELPELCDAIEQLFGEGAKPTGDIGNIGILIEPQEHSWVHGWHRDGLIEVPPESHDDPEVRGALEELFAERHMFNQVNCALYRDSTLWFVPGSHAQPDLPGQIQTSYTDRCPTKGEDQSEEEFEQVCLDHCRKFPGNPVQVHLEPGDYLVYRNAAWHCAHMVVYQPRATLHHNPTVQGKATLQYDWLAIRKRALERSRSDA